MRLFVLWALVGSSACFPGLKADTENDVVSDSAATDSQAPTHVQDSVTSSDVAGADAAPLDGQVHDDVDTEGGSNRDVVVDAAGDSDVGCAADCALLSDACNDGVCISGQCFKRPRMDGTACDDGGACTPIDRCETGQCVAGAPLPVVSVAAENATAVVARDDALYVLDTPDADRPDRVLAYRISTSGEIEQSWQRVLDGTATSVSVGADRVYVTELGSGVSSWTTTGDDPRVSLGFPGFHVARNGPLLAAAANNAFSIGPTFLLIDNASMETLGTLDGEDWTAQRVAWVSGKAVALAARKAGLKLVGVDNTDSIRLIGTIEAGDVRIGGITHPGTTEDVSVRGDRLFTIGDHGFRSYDLSQSWPSLLHERRSIVGSRIHADGTRVVISSADAAVVLDGESAAEIASIPRTGEAIQDAALGAGYLFAAFGGDGVVGVPLACQ